MMDTTYEKDSLPYKFLSLSILGLGIINLLVFFTPFIAYKHAFDPFDNGYQLLQYFAISPSEGIPIAISTWAIFTVSVVTAIYGCYLYYHKKHFNIYKHLRIIEKSSYAYLGIISTGMIIIFIMIDQIRFQYIQHSIAVPESGIGLQIFLWLNIIAPIIMRFVVVVIHARLAQNISSN